MKKSVALFLILLGVILIAVGYFMGAETSFTSLSFSLSSPKYHEGILHKPTGNGTEQRISFDAPREVKLESTLGSIVVLPSKDDQVHIEYSVKGMGWKQELTHNIKGERLNLYLDSRGIPFLAKGLETKLYLPKDVTTLHLMADMGKIELQGLHKLTTRLEAHMGSIEISNTHVQGEITLDMGSLEVDKVTLEDVKITLNMGSMDGNVRFEGKNSVKAEMGSIGLKLNQNPQELYLDLTTSMGSISGTRGGEKSSSKAELKIEASMGSIELSPSSDSEEDKD